MTKTPHYGVKRKPASPSRNNSRADLAMALLRATSVHELSQEGAARIIGVNKRTIGAWVRCEREMNVELVAAAPRLGDTFRRMWCSEGHEPLPYVAKRGSR